MPDEFSTEATREGDAIVIHVRGEIDMATTARLRDAIATDLGPRQKIVLDLAHVAYMDSACIHVLVQARGSLTADDGSLILRNPSTIAHRLLTIAGLEDLLHADAGEPRDSS